MGRPWQVGACPGWSEALCTGHVQLSLFLLGLADSPRKSLCVHPSPLPQKPVFWAAHRPLFPSLQRSLQAGAGWEKGSHRECGVRKKSNYSFTALHTPPPASYLSPSLTPCSEGAQGDPFLSPSRVPWRSPAGLSGSLRTAEHSASWALLTQLLHIPCFPASQPG